MLKLPGSTVYISYADAKEALREAQLRRYAKRNKTLDLEDGLANQSPDDTSCFVEGNGVVKNFNSIIKPRSQITLTHAKHASRLDSLDPCSAVSSISTPIPIFMDPSAQQEAEILTASTESGHTSLSSSDTPQPFPVPQTSSASYSSETYFSSRRLFLTVDTLATTPSPEALAQLAHRSTTDDMPQEITHLPYSNIDLDFERFQSLTDPVSSYDIPDIDNDVISATLSVRNYRQTFRRLIQRFRLVRSQTR